MAVYVDRAKVNAFLTEVGIDPDEVVRVEITPQTVDVTRRYHLMTTPTGDVTDPWAPTSP